MTFHLRLTLFFLLAGACTVRAGTFATGAWTNDASTGITSNKTIWAYHFGSATTATVNSVSVPGIADPSPYSQAEFDFVGNGSSVGSDTNNLTLLGGTGSALLAASYVDNTNPSFLTLKGLTQGSPYTVTFLSLGTNPKPGFTRVVFFASAGDSRMVEQSQFFSDNGFRVDYSFTATNTTQVVTITRVTADPFPLYALALRSGLIVTSTANSGACTLRQAFTDAEAIPGPDTITIMQLGGF